MTAPRVRIRGQQIAVQVSAARAGATTLVWAHGLGASRAIDDIAGLVDHQLLAASRRVVRYDAVGHGDSSTSGSAERYAWNELARDQLMLTSEIGVGQFVSVGESMGAATAIEVARLAPERVNGLILITPPAVWESRPPVAASYRVGADLFDAGQGPAVIEALRSAPAPAMLVGDGRWRLVMGRTADHFASLAPGHAAALLRGAATSDLPDPTSVSQIHVPALVLAWRGDDAHPVRAAEQLASALPRSRLVIASEPHHAQTWTKEIDQFMTEVDGPGRSG